MVINYIVEYVKEHIKEDIDRIRESYSVDVSPEVGRVMGGFVSYYADKSREEFPFYSKIVNIANGLERYLKGKIKKPLSLHETMKAGFQICRALKDKDKRALMGIETYFSQLVHKELELNGHLQLFP